MASPPTRPRTRTTLIAVFVCFALLSPMFTSAASAAPARPTGVETVGGDTTVRVKWDAASGVDDYQIRYRQWNPTHHSNAEVLARIVGGSQISIDDVPWQVALIAASQTNAFQGQFCGGTLVHRQYVVTAAHCTHGPDPTFTPLPASAIHIAAGHDTLSQIALTDRVPVAEIIRHPSYNPNTFENDIAILRLSFPSQAGETIKLRRGSSSTKADPFFVSGWGDLNFDAGQFPNVLRGVGVVDRETASGTCGDYGSFYDSSIMVCGGVAAGGKDACQGDSGGPLVSSYNGQWLLTGVVSFGVNCALAEFPGVYTKISAFVSWIESHIPDLGYRVATAGGAASAKTITGLHNGTIYEMNVRANDETGSSAWSKEVIGRPYTRPMKPRKIKATAGAGLVALNLKPPAFDGGANVKKYKVIYRPVGSSEWQLFRSGPRPTFPLVVGGLNGGTTYEFAVAAVNVAGRSRYTTPITATPS